MTYIYDEILDEMHDSFDPTHPGVKHEFYEVLFNKIVERVLERVAAQPAIVPAPSEPAAVVVYPAMRDDTVMCPSCGQKVGWYRCVNGGYECPKGCYQMPSDPTP